MRELIFVLLFRFFFLRRSLLLGPENNASLFIAALNDGQPPVFLLWLLLLPSILCA